MFRTLVQRVSKEVLNKVPSQCAVCKAWPAQPVCESCIDQFAQPRLRCHTCALPLAASVVAGITQCGACIKNPPPLDHCLAAVPYAYPWSDLIVQYKFGDQPGWANPFALLLRSSPWVEPALDAADIILPMPLTKQRLAQRGFNQALVLANILAPSKTHNQLLLRLRDGPAQSSLARADRLQNVKNAFVIDPLKIAIIQNKRIVLIDDVMTTGASLYAAAGVVRRAGATHITALVIARTE